jgi:hypothetical protein
VLRVRIAHLNAIAYCVAVLAFYSVRWHRAASTHRSPCMLCWRLASCPRWFCLFFRTRLALRVVHARKDESAIPPCLLDCRRGPCWIESSQHRRRPHANEPLNL